MKPRPIIISAVVAALASVAALIFAKLTIPFHYAERSINPHAVYHVMFLQEKGEKDPETIATRYLYFGGDYQTATPEWIQTSSKKFDENTVRVRIYDPRCEDDSVSSAIDRIYLHLDESQRWIPFRAEWSQKGRGKFGWTTEPTT